MLHSRHYDLIKRSGISVSRKNDINVVLSFKINRYSTYMYYFILMEKDKGSNNDLQNIMYRKLMNEQHETH
jgi:hypothetical protein